jgi:hypothetical protein
MLRYRPAGHSPDDSRLGRLVPDDDEHIRKYPLTVETAVKVEKILKLPSWHWTHDQGNEGSCVGHGSSMERAITNTSQNVLRKISPSTVRYDTIWLWNEAKKIDEWTETNPGDDNGTSVRAAYDVMRAQGCLRVRSMHLKDGVPTPWHADNAPDLNAGCAVNRWATTVDQMRSSIAAALPVTIGVNWYSNFDSPIKTKGGGMWIGKDDLGKIRGGHCVCIYGASDRRQAFRVKNSWGRAYPLVWLSYSAMERLLREDGEATLVTDR